MLPPWVHSHNCRKIVWFPTTTYKVLRKDSLGAGPGQVLYDLWPDHALIPPWRPGGATGPQEFPRSPGLQVWMALSPWWPLPPWAASAGKGQNGLCTVRAEKMKALTAERCWENREPGTAGERRAAPAPGQCREKPVIQASTTCPLLSSRPAKLVASCSEAWELKRREASCQLDARLIFSPEDQTTALVIPGGFWAKASLAINKLLLTAGEFWFALQHTCDGCKILASHFLITVSQVSLLLSLLTPKRRELEVQSQPTEILQMDLSLLSQGSASTHSISPPWESLRANFKAYTCLKRKQGEHLMQCSSGQPGTAAPLLQNFGLLAHPHTPPPPLTE